VSELEKYAGPQPTHIMRLCARLLIFLAEHWHIHYCCVEKRLNQSLFFFTLLFSFELGARTGQTDRQTDGGERPVIRPVRTDA